MPVLTRWSRSRVMSVLTVCLLMLSVGVNVLQARRIKAMEDAKSEAASTVGQKVVPLDGFSLDGLPVHRTVARDVPTVLYYFSPTCTWCERNWENVRALNQAANGQYRVVLLTRVRGVRDYLKQHNLEIDVVEGISESVVSGYRLSGTPQTLVASIEGLVTYDWRGAFTPRIERQIEELFGIALPGVVIPVKAPSAPLR
jgi:hypothetical protein